MSSNDQTDLYDPEPPAHFVAPMGLRWDGTITAGNLLTSIALGVSLLIWGVRLEDRVSKEEDMRTGLQQQLERYADERRHVEGDIRTGITRVDDKITALLMASTNHQPPNGRER